MRAGLKRRVEKLEAASTSGEVTWEECVIWSFRPESEQCLSNPEYAAFLERYNRSQIKVWMEPYTRPGPKVAEERG
jgi:hypothetical protein